MVLVTGGGSVAGRAIAHRFAALGACVMIADIDYALAGEVASQIREGGGVALAHRCDLAVEADASALVDRAVKEFGGLDVVINMAGAWLKDDPFDHWGRIVGSNLMGTMYVTRAALDVLKRRGGAIVNIASDLGLKFGAEDRPAYSAAKAGIVHFTASLRPLLQAHRIRVNCLVPDALESVDEFALSVVDLALREDYAGRIVLFRNGSAREVVMADDPGYRLTEPY